MNGSTRREFFSWLRAAGGSVAIGSAAASLRSIWCDRDPDTDATVLASDDDFWAGVAREYPVDRSQLNLNNAGVSPAPRCVLDAFRRHIDEANALPSHHLWGRQVPHKENVRRGLARLSGCDPEEIAITRNASEGLEACQFGLDVRPGDEVLCTELDYRRMVMTFQQRERRDGIKLVQFAIPAPLDDPQVIVDLYRQHISERTRLILACHVVSPTAQILPVREIVALGRERGIPVIIDGAHAFAHLDSKIADVGADYYATSLHKWLCAPHGCGMLYVKRDKIDGLWPLMAAHDHQDADIRKFEEIGTAPLANPLAIAEALVFHEGIGATRKHARLVWLRDRWAKRLAAHDRVHLATSLAPGAAAGFAAFTIDGMRHQSLVSHLWNEHHIAATAYPVSGIGHESVIRISPHVYTTVDELDRFCDIVEGVLRDGLPR